MSPEQFRALMVNPKTGPRLIAMLQDNARVDAAIAADARALDDAVAVPLGQHECCLDHWRVVKCDGTTDLRECWCCGFQWEEPCR